MSHIGNGIIMYDPPREGMTKRVDGWCVANVDKEITRYYRWWVKKELWIDLYQPSFNAHISIIRGEYICPDKIHLWKKYQGKEVSFEYEHDVRFSGDTANDRPGYFYFVNAKSPEMDEIRNELGLRIYPNYHITIGRLYY